MASPASFTVVTTPVIAPAWVFTGIAIAFSLGRFSSRRWLGDSNKLGWDDAVLAMSLILTVAGTSLLTATIIAGTRVTSANLPTTLPNALVMTIATNCLFAVGIPLSKISVAIFLVRIFEPTRLTKWILYGGCGFVFVWSDIIFILNWVRCDPAPADWNPIKYPHATCFSGNIPFDATYSICALSVIQDFGLALYPAFKIKNLQMPRKKKIYLTIVLGLGPIAAAAAIVKAVEIGHVSADVSNLTAEFRASFFSALWCCIEACLVISAACIPTFLPVLRWARAQSSTYWSMASSLIRGSSTNMASSRWSRNSAEGHGSSTESQETDYPFKGESGSEHIVMQKVSASHEEV